MVLKKFTSGENATGSAEISALLQLHLLQQVAEAWVGADAIVHTIDPPGSIFTQALGINNQNQIVGVYNDAAGASHGFIYNTKNKTYQSLDDPNRVGTTLINGINDKGDIVGFYVDVNGSTDGFAAEPVAR